MNKRKAPAPVEATDEPAIVARLEKGPGWGVLMAAGGLAIVAGVGVLLFRGLRGRKA